MNNRIEKKILLVGIDFFDETMLRQFSGTWKVAVLDIDPQQVSRAAASSENISGITGDASSRLTWSRIDIDSIQYVISAVRNPEVNLEILRILRRDLKKVVPVMIFCYRAEEAGLFSQYAVELVNPFELGIQYVLRKTDKNYFRAVHIGLGSGELVEVKILAHSHLVDRKLRCLHPASWHVAAVYRNNQMILPTGNCKLKVGDRVLLVGDPTVLENISKILVRGVPQFPLQYGKNIDCLLDRSLEAMLDEVAYWLEFSQAQKINFIPLRHQVGPRITEKIKRNVTDFEIGPVADEFREIFNSRAEGGMVAVAGTRKNRRRLGRSFLLSQRPVLICRQSFPYSEVVVSLNGPDPALAIESGLEIAKMLDVDFRTVYVTLPKQLRSTADGRALAKRQELVTDFEGIYKSRIEFTQLEGNPVRMTLDFLKSRSRSLLVMVSRYNSHHSMIRPHVPYLIVSRCTCSSLLVPVEEPDHE